MISIMSRPPATLGRQQGAERQQQSAQEGEPAMYYTVLYYTVLH